LQEQIELEATERQKKIEEGLKLSEKLRGEAEQRLTTIEAERRSQANARRVRSEEESARIRTRGRDVSATQSSRIAEASLIDEGDLHPTPKRKSKTPISISYWRVSSLY